MNVLRELRKQYGMSLKSLASEFGVTHQVLSRWELGEREPDFESIMKIADYFGVSIDYLLGHETQKSPTVTTAGLTNEEQALLAFWRNLNTTNKKSIGNLIKALLPEQAEKVAKFAG